MRWKHHRCIGKGRKSILEDAASTSVYTLVIGLATFCHTTADLCTKITVLSEFDEKQKNIFIFSMGSDPSRQFLLFGVLLVSVLLNPDIRKVIKIPNALGIQ